MVIFGFLTFVYRVDQAQSAAVGGRSSDLCILLLDFALKPRRTIPA
jgi:hypothetical protein